MHPDSRMVVIVRPCGFFNEMDNGMACLNCGGASNGNLNIGGFSGGGCRNCLDPHDEPITGYEKGVVLSPGEELSYTARLFGGDYLEIDRLGADNRTLQTKDNHCLKVGDSIHLDVCSGFCTTQSLSSCVYVQSVPALNQFTLHANTTPDVAYTFTPTSVVDLDPTTSGVPVKARIAKAANLDGYRVRLRLNVGAHRDQKLLSLGAIASGSKQLQIKGYFPDIAAGDSLEIGSFTGTVVSSQKAMYDNVCYTIVQIKEPSTVVAKFTDKVLVLLKPQEMKIETVVPALKCGWISVAIAGHETKKLIKFLTSQRGNPTRIGFWELVIEWGGASGATGADKWPEHIANDLSNFYNFVPLDRGVLYII